MAPADPLLESRISTRIGTWIPASIKGTHGRDVELIGDRSQPAHCYYSLDFPAQHTKNSVAPSGLEHLQDMGDTFPKTYVRRPQEICDATRRDV